MKKNDIVTAHIVGYGSNAEGIAKVDNVVCFVPFALVGEKVTFKVLKVNKNIAFCKLLEVLTPSEDRVRPLCKFFEKCGGCQLQHARIKAQHKIKSNTIKDCFRKIANLDVEVSNAVKSENEYNYRNKIQLPIRNIGGVNKIGFFYENSHRIVEIDECVIQKPFANGIIKAINEFIKQTNISCYSDETNQGLLKHVVAREVSGRVIIVIVINGKELNYQSSLIAIFSKYFNEFTLIVNENTKSNNVILGDKFTVVYGNGYFDDEFLGIKYPVYPQSFMQVNNFVKEKLYSGVIKGLSLDENSTVIDAYSGAGVMTAMLAKHAKKAIGIEIVKEAVASADELRKINKLCDKMVNFCAPCEEILPDVITAEKMQNSNISVVLDPPRKGVDVVVLDAILKAMPDKIAYVACSPQSLARDVGILVGSLKWVDGQLKKVENYSPNYKIELVTPYDMFPQTKHIETLVILTKSAIVHQMKLNPEPFDLIKTGKKTIELRLFDEKRKKIKGGDLIEFTNTESGEKLNAKVKSLYTFTNFDELYNTIPLTKCGYTEKNVATASPLDMQKYYSLSEQAKYGVIGIEIELVKL